MLGDPFGGLLIASNGADTYAQGMSTHYFWLVL